MISLREAVCRDTVACLAYDGFQEVSNGRPRRQLLPTNQQSGIPKKESSPMKRGGRTMRHQAKISPAVISRCAGNLDRDPEMIFGAQSEGLPLSKMQEPNTRS